VRLTPITRDYRANHHAAVRTHTTASPESLYARLICGSTWPTWINLDSMTLEREGIDGGESVGAIRVFRFRRAGMRFVTREQIAELIPNRRFGYTLVAGLPLQNYRATVDLIPGPGGGTDIRWSGSWWVAIPGAGYLTRLVMRRLYRQFSDGLVRHVQPG
jgi:Polyketide cyclase / dehydrase and lipid transport